MVNENERTIGVESSSSSSASSEYTSSRVSSDLYTIQERQPMVTEPTAATEPAAAVTSLSNSAAAPADSTSTSIRHDLYHQRRYQRDAPAGSGQDNNASTTVTRTTTTTTARLSMKAGGSGSDDDNDREYSDQYRLPNGQIITAKNTMQSHINVVVQGIVNANSENDNSSHLFRLPNGQIITAKNTIQSHIQNVEYGNNGGLERGENQSDNSSRLLPRLPNGQVVTAKNTIQSHLDDNVGDRGDSNSYNVDNPPADTSPAPLIIQNDAARTRRGHKYNHPHKLLGDKANFDNDNADAATIAAAAVVAGSATAGTAAAATAGTIFVDAYPHPTSSIPTSNDRNNEDNVESMTFAMAEAALAVVVATNDSDSESNDDSAGQDHIDNDTVSSPNRHDKRNTVGGSTTRRIAVQVAVALVLVAASVVTTTLLVNSQNAAADTRVPVSPPVSPPLSQGTLAPTSSSSIPPQPSNASLSNSSLTPSQTAVEPTVRPTPAPAIGPITVTTARPSSSRAPTTRAPTTLAPTSMAPSMLPTTTPTTAAPSRATVVTKYINRIKLSNSTLTVPKMYTPPLVDVTSAEQAALSWLIYIDLLPLWPGTVANQGRLRQRYALLTLLVQFPDFTTVTATNSRNAANETECDWLFVQECTRVVATSPSASNTSTNSSSDSSSSVGAILGNGEEEDEDDVVVDVVINLYAIQSYTLPGSTLSPDLGLLSHLESFDASTNGLVGSIPAALGMATWSNLRLFAVSDNALTGRLSPSLGATWTKLAYFGVNNNALTGSLPPTLGVAWTKLYAFFVSTNQLTGTIPESLARYWTNVTYAYFYRNDFIGSMPSGFCAQTNVTELSADCFDEVQCDDDCCDFCCSDTGEENEVCS